MSVGIEAAGDIATGALLGRAVEPFAGEHGESAHGVCLNCGTALIGEFCHSCGQNGHVHKTLASIGHDLLHGVFHFEGKVWRTLPMLVAHPGSLTRRYIDGERARFVSPLALFLFFVFLMFATISSIGGSMGSGMEFDATPRSREERMAAVDGQIAKAQAELTKAEALAAKGGPDAEDAASDIVGLKATLSGLKVARSTIATSKDGHTRVTPSDAKTGWARLDHGIEKANTNPELALYKLQSSAYKYSWALIPISVPFVALLFLWRRRFKLYDHAIFVTYSLTFMLLLVTVSTLLIATGPLAWIGGCLIAFAPPVHLFAQLRGTYGLRWFSALWRTIALMIFGSITLILFAMLLLGMGLME